MEQLENTCNFTEVAKVFGISIDTTKNHQFDGPYTNKVELIISHRKGFQELDTDSL